MLVLLVGCAAPPTSCTDGFVLGEDGQCYESAGDDDTGADTGDDVPVTIDAVLDALPACEPLQADTRLDLWAGCVDGACVGMTFDEVNDAFGEEGACESYYAEVPEWLSCDWSNGVSVSLDDMDLDGAPDRGLTIGRFSVSVPYSGASAEGLGLQAGVRCFVDAFGRPDSVSWRLGEEGDYALYSVSWSEHGVYAYDWSDPQWRSDVGDGYVDALSFYGSDAEL